MYWANVFKRGSRLALHHPAAHLLAYTMGRCPMNKQWPWRVEVWEVALEWGPHASLLEHDAIKTLHLERDEKIKQVQAQLVV
jgi:hypothetical protein